MKDNLENNYESDKSDFDFTPESEEVKERLNDADEQAKPQQNFSTETPIGDEIYERAAVIPRTKNNTKTLMVLVAAAVAVLFAFAGIVFFIVRGTSKPSDVAVVKDNSLSKGVNAVTNSGSGMDYQSDYQNRYAGNQANAGGVINPYANMPVQNANMGIAGFNPPTGNNGDIVAPPMPPNITGNQPNNFKPSNGGGSGSGRKTVEPPPVKVTPNTQIVEAVNNEDASDRSASGGRNDQVSLFFYDSEGTNDGATMTRIEYDRSAPAKPLFGTVLPVRILGRLHTLGTNGLARMELTRTVGGSWGTIPQGTMFIGRVSGGEANRLFVSLIGYIDRDSQRLVALGGDLQGDDGALGMKGDVKRLGSRWAKVFGEVISTAKQVGSAYLLGRSGGGGAVINNGSLEKTSDAFENKDVARYTVIEAGSQGYIVMTDLPPAIESDERLGSIKPLSDEELQKLIKTDTSAEIERLIPQLSPAGKQIARRALENK